MEENKNYEEKKPNQDDCCKKLEEQTFIKCLLCCILTFLGAFCAFYVLADWHMKKMMNMPMIRPNPYAAEHILQKEFKKADKMFKPGRNFAYKENSSIVHMEQDDDEYKIIIDLRAFDNNENNVKVSTSGNILSINAKSVKKSKFNEQISEFQQNFMFGDDVNLANLKKETSGNKLVIKIPLNVKDFDD